MRSGIWYIMRGMCDMGCVRCGEGYRCDMYVGVQNCWALRIWWKKSRTPSWLNPNKENIYA